MSDVRVPLIPTQYYHVFNHAVGSDNFFRSGRDYNFFLSKMKEHIIPVTDLLAYCLQPNHFHFIARIKEAEIIRQHLKVKLGHEKYNKHIGEEGFIELQLSRVYSNLFSSYAKYYNFMYGRMGTLFKRPFQRIPIETMEYLHTVIGYVHLNPLHHNRVRKPEDWVYSSYNNILNQEPSFVNHSDVIELYGGKENFLAYHKLVDESHPSQFD